MTKSSSINTAIQEKLFDEVNNRKISKFQFDVYSALLEVPSGKVTTYKEIAKRIHCNSSQVSIFCSIFEVISNFILLQAIGQALKKNTFAPDVPCHRVVRSDLSLGGFSGSTDNETVGKKVKLLESEGIIFENTSRTSESSDYKIGQTFLFSFSSKVL